MSHVPEANINGKSFEDVETDFIKSYRSLIVFEQREFYTPYGKVKADLFVEGIPGFDIGFIIECKFQEAGGSVSDKFYRVASDLEHFVKIPGIILVNDNHPPEVQKNLTKLNFLVEDGIFGRYFLGVYTRKRLQQKFFDIIESKSKPLPKSWEIYAKQKELT